MQPAFERQDPTPQGAALSTPGEGERARAPRPREATAEGRAPQRPVRSRSARARQGTHLRSGGQTVEPPAPSASPRSQQALAYRSHQRKKRSGTSTKLLIAILCVLTVTLGLSIWLAVKVLALEGTAQEAWQQSASNTSNLAALEAAVSDIHDQVYGSSSSTSDGANDGDASQASANTSSTAVASPHTASGTYDTGDAELNQLVKDYCDAHTDVYDAYLGVAWAEWVENDNNQDPQGSDWWIQYAKDQFTNGSGNCYNFAAAIQELLRYYGYEDAKAFPAIVKFRSGDWGPHGIVTVTDTEDGTRKIIDASRGTEGWMCNADSILYEVDDTKG